MAYLFMVPSPFSSSLHLKKERIEEVHFAGTQGQSKGIGASQTIIAAPDQYHTKGITQTQTHAQTNTQDVGDQYCTLFWELLKKRNIVWLSLENLVH